MKRSAALLAFTPMLLAPLYGCPDGGGPLPMADDAGMSGLPDARVIGPRDAGPSDVDQPLPTLSTVSPSTGPETGGTRVTLRGTSFVEPAEVFFGDQPATSVVVLDEVSIAATTPPGAIGAVTVRVNTPGGEAELPEGFFYHRELRLDAVEPARIPDEGGVEVAVVGEGFDEHTLVFFDRKPLRGLRVVSEERIVGYAPALEPGRPEVRVLNRDAAVRRGDVVVVYGTPDVASLMPGYGAATGGDTQEIAGEGLLDAETVTIGGEAARSFAIQDNRLITAEAPALAEGVYDVTVANGDASGTLTGGYVAIDRTAPGLAVLGVLPARVEEGSGQLITVVGRGFGAAGQVSVAGQRLTLVDSSPNALTIMAPQTLAPGRYDVTVFAGASQATLSNGLEVYAPVEVDSITPPFGPAAGGTIVAITGSGFTQGAEVRIADVPLSNVEVLSDTELTGVTVAGTHGLHDVVVTTDGGRGVLENGFAFQEPFQIVRIEPNEGSVAGNTYVSIFGRGFNPPVEVKFGGVDGLFPIPENGSIIGVRTQPANTGPVDVEVTTASEEQTLPQAYTFYDPRLITGGAWGGPIEGSVNVAVQTFQGQPLPGMVVQLGYDADLRYTAVTDENGLATISSPEIRGAQTVTAGAPGIEFVTYYEIDARNLTMFASPYPMSMPPDAPVSPCPTGVPPPVVRGKIFKFKSSLDPVTMPGWVPVARITYTQPNVFTANPPEPPEQVDFVFQDGGEYEIVVMRAGTVAVYAELGDYNAETQEFIPRRMGIARNVPVAPETITEDINISLDINLDQTTRIRLDDPPMQQPGPSVNAVFPFLNLQSEGVIPFPATAVFGGGDVILENLPDVPESAFFYMGGSFTQGANGGLQNPYSLTLLETAVPFEDGVDLGPFLQMPQNMAPKPGQLLERGVVSWDQGGIAPDITTINVVDIVGVTGRCCVDANMNGQCEDTEAINEGGLPQQFNRWTMFAEGGQASYVLPLMPSGVVAFDAPRTYPWLLQMAIAPRFSYEEFIYNQFSPFFWKSWVVTSSQFTVKEETD